MGEFISLQIIVLGRPEYPGWIARDWAAGGNRHLVLIVNQFGRLVNKGDCIAGFSRRNGRAANPDYHGSFLVWLLVDMSVEMALSHLSSS
jgi:hypothetical protein